MPTPEAHTPAPTRSPWPGLPGLVASAALALPGAWLARQCGLGLGDAACRPAAAIGLLLLAPVLEEYLLRGALQPWLQQRWPARFGPLSLANGLCALLFGLGHALHQQHPAAFATVLPALWLGLLWERCGQRLRWPMLAHALFNAALWLGVCSGV